jgi:hypothetical protein
MNIDTMKAMLSKKGGIAPTNRFLILMTAPKVSLINTDPSVLLGTLLSGGGIGNIFNDPRDITLLAKSVNIPGRNISTTDKQIGKQSMKIPYDFIDGDVAMSFYLTNDGFARRYFADWLGCVVDADGYKVGYKKDYCTDIQIIQLNQKNLPVFGVTLENAYPLDMSAIDLDTSEDTSIQEMSVNFAYDRYMELDASLDSLMSIKDSVLPQITNTLDLISS